MNRWLKQISIASAIGMFIVLLMGALVTKTDSGRGCGDDWPLCNGKFIPSYTVDSMIEYSHRFVSGVEGLLVLAAFVGVMRLVRRKDARWYAGLALFFTVVQAILGAMAVKWEQSSLVMALHFGISMLAFACTLLLAIVLIYSESIPERGLAATDKASGASFAVPSKGLSYMIWFTTVYCYVVVYLGAFVRHTKSWGGCMGWPLCNGQVIPELSGATGIVFLHRVAALLLFVAIALMLYMLRKRQYPHEIVKAGYWAISLVILQIFSGAYVTFTITSEWHLLSGLIHTLLIAGLFSILVYLSVRVIQLKR
ncbi:heme A synthase [Paenibacillus sp. J2TS4]|uniref:COX15/CtaA family protein n=1 Tax=Paenibacillus sp. J2TS4 TaxID=2807194 RepID=UPI001B24BE64|nr:COX15/CtaA family protein [Paenibacillus sp. J2TS4]GIP31168.1 heme A synthase [Paenibacillus sp. J2TS4]